MTRLVHVVAVTFVMTLAGSATDAWAQRRPGDRPPVMAMGEQGTVTPGPPADGGRRGRPPLRGSREGGPGRGRGAEPMTAAEVERLFDRYVLGEARVALQLTREQMVTFAPRFDELQATRRRLQRERQRLLNDLAAVSRERPQDEAAMAERLRALEAFRVSAEQQLRETVAGVDALLTVPQRARLRVFEGRIERQKLELLSRARAASESGSSAATPAP